MTESGFILAGAVAWGYRTGGFDTGRAAVNVVDGRVNFIDYLAQFDHAGGVGIVICGPQSFTEYAITAAEDFIERSQNNREFPTLRNRWRTKENKGAQESTKEKKGM
jgi:hypothetical protein